MVRFLFMDTIEIEPAVRAKALESDSARAALAGARELLSKIPDFEAAPIEAALRAVPEISGAKPKVVFLAVRVAATGTTVSPPLWESLELLGRERTLRRLDAALADGVDDPATHP
jgi:glutamyl-tRNA synthetase